MDKATGNLRFRCEGDVVLKVFNFTGFEIWKLIFPDGTIELSNYALDLEPVQFRPQETECCPNTRLGPSIWFD